MQNKGRDGGYGSGQGGTKGGKSGFKGATGGFGKRSPEGSAGGYSKKYSQEGNAGRYGKKSGIDGSSSGFVRKNDNESSAGEFDKKTGQAAPSGKREFYGKSGSGKAPFEKGGFGKSRTFGDRGKPSFNKDKSFGIKDKGFGVKDNGFGVKDKGFGSKDTGSGAKEHGLGEKEQGFGTRAQGLDARNSGSDSAGSDRGRRANNFDHKGRKFSPGDKKFGPADKRFPPADKRFSPADKRFGQKEKQGFAPMEESEEELLNDRLEGRNSVLEALKAGRTINKIFVSKGDREGSIKQIVAMAIEKRILVQEVERGKLDSMSSTFSHQGVIAFVSPKDYVEVDDILAIAAEKGEAPFIIILDEITDPQNLGSILRTADAAGVHGVIIPKRRAIGLTAVVSKASAGAVEYVPVARVTNLAQTIEHLKKQNIWVGGTAMTGGKSFYESDLKGPIAIVIGSEGEGIGKLILDKCDFTVSLPMKGNIESLNAGVAGGIIMYEILRQRSL